MQRHSRKRKAILEAMRETNVHPSAEWIYNKLKPDIPDLSLGTVYRNLSQFMEAGHICYVGSVNGQERYDADVSNHVHFICSCCGSIQDIFAPSDSLLTSIADSLSGVRVDGLTFSGLCADCYSRKN